MCFGLAHLPLVQTSFMDDLKPRRAGTAVERKNAIHGRPAESTLTPRSLCCAALVGGGVHVARFSSFPGSFQHLKEGADLATTEVATTSPPEIATTRTYIHQT